MRPSHATALRTPTLAPLLATLLAPLFAGCSLTAPDRADALLVPISGREQHTAIADFMQERANARAPECGTVHGKLVGVDSHGAGGLRVMLRNETGSSSTRANEHGEFRLRAPSGGSGVLVVTSTGTDSIALPEFPRFSAHVVTVEFQARERSTTPLAIGRVYTHSAGCAGPPE